jgi:hypothetical protein
MAPLTAPLVQERRPPRAIGGQTAHCGCGDLREFERAEFSPHEGASGAKPLYPAALDGDNAAP